jgi:hypothetical protein
MTAPHLRLEHDDLQTLLSPLQAADPAEFTNGLGPAVPSLDDTLQWEPDGVPTWWPMERPAEEGTPWTAAQRRAVLLARLREHLPPGFPPHPTSRAEKQQLVDSLRLTYEGLRSGASHILSSS